MGQTTTANHSVIDERIHGSRLSHFIREFFTNSAYFPLANMFLELLSSSKTYSSSPDPYVLLLAALLQARFISERTYVGRSVPLLGNLIGPLVYTTFELLMGGGSFTDSANHIAYWGFAFAIGFSRQMQIHLPPNIGSLFILVESTLRTSILLVMYIILHYEIGELKSLQGFLADPTHIYIAVVVPFSGLMLGVALMDAERNESVLRGIAGQIKVYSQWVLGKQLLAQAERDPASISHERHERSIVVMEIRGFNPWCEKQDAEHIVAAVNTFYAAAEPTWQRFHALRVKLDADEVMLAFTDATTAVAAALEMHEKVGEALGEFGLSAGIGVHTGLVVEGILGSTDFKGYDLLGETVNITRGISDNAGMGEILLSNDTVQRLQRPLPLSRPMGLSLPQSHVPITVYSVVLVNPDS
jgi:adenylate cyclase